MQKVILKKVSGEASRYVEVIINDYKNNILTATRIAAYPRFQTKLRKSFDDGIEFASEERSDKIKYTDIDFSISVPQLTQPSSLEECFELIIQNYFGTI